MSDNFKKVRTSELINELMNTDDPATVGLRRILKSKKDSSDDFPFKAHSFDDFATNGEKGSVFTKEEERLIEVEKALLDYQEEIEELKKTGEETLKKTRNEALEEGKKIGIEEGYAKASEKFDKAVEEIKEDLKQQIFSMKESYTKLLSSAHTITLKLAMVAAEKIIQTEIKENHDIVLNTIKESLKYLVSRDKFRVRVSTEDFDNVVKNKTVWTNLSDNLENIEIVKDERLQKADCIIESDSGLIDSRISAKNDGLTEIFEQQWNNIMNGSHTTKNLLPETTAPEKDTESSKSEEV